MLRKLIDFCRTFDYKLADPEFSFLVCHPLTTTLAVLLNGTYTQLDSQETIDLWYEQWEGILGEDIDLYRAVAFVNKPFRLMLLWQFRDTLPKQDLWELFKSTWVSIEYPSQDKELLVVFYNFFKELNKTRVMKPPKLYRGINYKDNSVGFSWTSSLTIAEFFANRFNQKGRILEGDFEASDIWFKTDDRGEKEYVLVPSVSRKKIKKCSSVK